VIRPKRDPDTGRFKASPKSDHKKRSIATDFNLDVPKYPKASGPRDILRVQNGAVRRGILFQPGTKGAKPVFAYPFDAPNPKPRRARRAK
jgi:hypothetical protein